jgi:putative PIN family toxin of toxin-antitoxin system
VRAVFDTNVLVAAFAAEGVCAALLRRARIGDFRLVLCPVIIQEFQRVLRRKLAASPDEVRDALGLLEEAGELVMPEPGAMPRMCRDRADDAILACALAARAEFLVTGDNDLLGLRTFQRIRIVRPRDFEALFAD